MYCVHMGNKHNGYISSGINKTVFALGLIPHCFQFPVQPFFQFILAFSNDSLKNVHLHSLLYSFIAILANTLAVNFLHIFIAVILAAMIAACIVFCQAIVTNRFKIADSIGIIYVVYFPAMVTSKVIPAETMCANIIAACGFIAIVYIIYFLAAFAGYIMFVVTIFANIIAIW